MEACLQGVLVTNVLVQTYYSVFLTTLFNILPTIFVTIYITCFPFCKNNTILNIMTSFLACKPGLFDVPELLVLPHSATEGKMGCGDTPRPGRRASRPPEPPAFPS